MINVIFDKILKLLKSKKGKELEIILDNDSNKILKVISLLKTNKFEFSEFNIKKRTLESIFVNYINTHKNDKL